MASHTPKLRSATVVLGKFLQHCPRLDQVGKCEALGEGGVDRREQALCLGNPALLAEEPGKVAGGAQLPQSRGLVASGLKSHAKLPLALRGGSSPDAEHTGVEPVDLGCHVPLAV